MLIYILASPLGRAWPGLDVRSMFKDPQGMLLVGNVNIYILASPLGHAWSCDQCLNTLRECCLSEMLIYILASPLGRVWRCDFLFKNPQGMKLTDNAVVRCINLII